MISKEALEEIIQVSEMYPDGIHKKEELKAIKWLSGGRQQGKTYQLIKDQQKEIKKLKELQERIDKAIEIYENRNTCKYKKERFMKDKSTSDLMYEALTGGDK